MKEPWQIWTDEYWRARKKKKSHDMAIVDGISAVAFHMAKGGRADYGQLIARFKSATDAWAQRDDGNWDDLRETLRHIWTDHELAR